MISLFLGLSTANVLLLGCVFGLGLFATDAAAKPTGVYVLHVSMAIAAGLMTTLTHVGVYTYFMATHKWLLAATHKADLDHARFVAPPLARKARALKLALAGIGATLLAMFAGAATDPTLPSRWVPAPLHLASGLAAVAINGISALAQFPIVRQQSQLIDEALAILNHPSPTAQLSHT